MSSDQIGARIAAVYELQSAWLEPKLRKMGISWTTFQLLSAVAGAGRNASQVEVARRIGVTPATLSETVFGHVNKGFLEQVSSTRDRRVKVLQLTDQAKTLMRQIKRHVADSEALAVQGLSERDSATLARLLDRVMANFEGERE